MKRAVLQHQNAESVNCRRSAQRQPAVSACLSIVACQGDWCRGKEMAMRLQQLRRRRPRMPPIAMGAAVTITRLPMPTVGGWRWPCA